MQTASPFTIASLSWAGTLSVTSVGSNTLTLSAATMSASTSVLTTGTGVTAVIASGTVRGLLTSSAASTHSITASVATATTLSISGTALTLGGSGVLTTVGTGAVTIGAGVTVTTHTLAGSGPYTLISALLTVWRPLLRPAPSVCVLSSRTFLFFANSVILYRWSYVYPHHDFRIGRHKV